MSTESVPKDFGMPSAGARGIVASHKLAAQLSVRTAESCAKDLLHLLASNDGVTRCDLDASDVRVIDAAGLQVLLAFERSLKARGASLELRGCSPVLRQLLAHVGLLGRLGTGPAGVQP